MYPRTNYEMTETDLAALLDACNRAWSALGAKMGFDHMTVQPVAGKGSRFFTAVPSETDVQRAERFTRKAEETRQVEITRLSAEIAERQKKLAAIQD